MNAHARRQTGAKNESLHSAAQRLYDEVSRVNKAAIDLLIREIRKRPALHEAAYRVAAETIIDNLDRSDRARILRGADTGAVTVSEPIMTGQIVPIQFIGQSAASVKAGNDAYKRFAVKLTGLYLAKFKDGNGGEFLLGQATPDQLRASAAHYMGQGATMVRTARWLEKIIASAKEGEPIHNSLSLKQIEKMQRDAFNSEV